MTTTTTFHSSTVILCVFIGAAVASMALYEISELRARNKELRQEVAILLNSAPDPISFFSSKPHGNVCEGARQ